MADIVIDTARILGYMVAALLSLGTLMAIGTCVAIIVHCRQEDRREAEQRRIDDAFDALVAQVHQEL